MMLMPQLPSNEQWYESLDYPAMNNVLSPMTTRYAKAIKYSYFGSTPLVQCLSRANGLEVGPAVWGALSYDPPGVHLSWDTYSASRVKSTRAEKNPTFYCVRIPCQAHLQAELMLAKRWVNSGPASKTSAHYWSNVQLNRTGWSVCWTRGNPALLLASHGRPGAGSVAHLDHSGHPRDSLLTDEGPHLSRGWRRDPGCQSAGTPSTPGYTMVTGIHICVPERYASAHQTPLYLKVLQTISGYLALKLRCGTISLIWFDIKLNLSIVIQ